MNKNHIGQSFDLFLKEENIEISEEEIRKQISNMFKDKCMEFLQKKLESTSENYLKEQIEDVLKEAYDKGAIMPDYKIKRTKLPRKLKKKYKKESKICFDVEYKKPIYEYKITIPINESDE